MAAGEMLQRMAAESAGQASSPGKSATMAECHVGFFEIYQGQLYDLLAGKKRVYARENSRKKVCIVGLTRRKVSSLDEFCRQVIDIGCNERRTGRTGANSDSSRSHAILQLTVEMSAEEDRDHSNSKSPNRKPMGQISFIDLAGSERGADRQDVSKQTKLEGSEINKSLLALKECIRAMDQESSHLPFRQSKLTQATPIFDMIIHKASEGLAIFIFYL